MDLKERAQALSEELDVNSDKIHLVIGVTPGALEDAFNGHGKWFDVVEKFFTDRQTALEKYSDEQMKIIRSFERFIPRRRRRSA